MTIKTFSLGLLYNKCQEHDDNIFKFSAFLCTLDIWKHLYFPNYEKQPWLVQCKIGNATVSFWPHKNKCSIQTSKHYKEYIGYEAVRQLILAEIRKRKEMVKIGVDKLMEEGVLE